MQEFLLPININSEEYTNYQIGKYISADASSISHKSLVLLSIDEYRGGGQQYDNSFSQFRKEFYELAAGNWKLPIYDIGHIKQGATIEDSYYALQTVLNYVVGKKATPIIIGGSQDLLYVAYQVLSEFNIPFNYAAIDSTIPLSNYKTDELRSDNLLNFLINDPKELLFQFSNIGYQSYLTSYQIIDTLNAMSFDTHRLGEIVKDLKESEPILRSAELISFNWNSVQSQTEDSRIEANPNGFNPREICALAKYAGLSAQVKTVGFFNYIENSSTDVSAKLLAQSIWYFVEGKNLGTIINNRKTNYKKYIVMHKDKEIVFLQDEIINKWWIQLTQSEGVGRETLIPCTEKDYIKATENEIPDRYWKSIQKYL